MSIVSRRVIEALAHYTDICAACEATGWLTVLCFTQSENLYYFRKAVPECCKRLWPRNDIWTLLGSQPGWTTLAWTSFKLKCKSYLYYTLSVSIRLSVLYTLRSKKRSPFSYDCSFYKCWPIFTIFGTQYTEFVCNITFIYLPYTYCCYTTLENIGYNSKGLTGQSHTWMHKNWCPIFVRIHKPHFRQSWH